MKVQDIMTATVITVGPNDSFKDVVHALVENGISSVPVVDEAGTMLGIVTEADLLPKQARPARRRSMQLLGDVLIGRMPGWVARAESTCARDVMTEDVITANPEEDLHAATRRMLSERVKRLPVVDHGRLVGIVSRADILRVFSRSDGSVRASVEGLLEWCMYVPPEHQVDVAVVDGVVTLGGTVRRDSDVRVVEAIVRGVEGVIDVHSELTARERDPKRAAPKGPEGFGAH